MEPANTATNTAPAPAPATVTQAPATNTAPAPAVAYDITQNVVINRRPKGADGKITSENTTYPIQWSASTFTGNPDFFKKVAMAVIDDAFTKEYKDVAEGVTPPTQFTPEEVVILVNKLLDNQRGATFGTKIVGDEWDKYAIGVTALLAQDDVANISAIKDFIGKRRMGMALNEDRLNQYITLLTKVGQATKDEWVKEATPYAIDKLNKKIKAIHKEAEQSAKVADVGNIAFI